MSALTAFLGEGPRIKLMEALVRLGSMEFSRAELAAEANLWPMTVNRLFGDLVSDNLVFEVKGGSRPVYRSNEMSARLWLLTKVGAGLAVIQSEGLDAPDSDRTREGRRRALERISTPLGLDVDDLVREIIQLGRPRPHASLQRDSTIASTGAIRGLLMEPGQLAVQSIPMVSETQVIQIESEIDTE